ncbi:hypothetical protein EW145_g6710, partial [Phellinidium pouzarii]
MSTPPSSGITGGSASGNAGGSGKGTYTQSAANVLNVPAGAMDLFDSATYKPMNYKVEFLSNENYPMWRIKTAQALCEHLVYEVGTGLSPLPVPMDPVNPTADELKSNLIWHRMNARARGLILERVTNKHVHLIEGTSTSRDVWRRIEQHFMKDAAMGPAYAIQSLFTHKWDDSSSSLEENLAYVQDKVNELRKFQGNLDDLMNLLHALAIIQSLPSTWSQTVSVLMSKDNTDLENVITTLKRTAHHNAADAGESALALKTKGRVAKPKSIKKCTNCGKTRHTKEMCWALGGGAAGKGPSGNKFGSGAADQKGKTINAVVADDSDSDGTEVEASATNTEAEIDQGLIVHIQSLTAPKKNLRNSTPSPFHSSRTPSLSSAHTLDTQHPSAISVSTLGCEISDWILDSGASAHIVNNKNLLFGFQSCVPIPVKGFGEGMQLSAIGKGRAKLSFKPEAEKFTLEITNVLYVPGASCNIISASKLMKCGIDILGQKDKFKL